MVLAYKSNRVPISGGPNVNNGSPGRYLFPEPLVISQSTRGCKSAHYSAHACLNCVSRAKKYVWSLRMAVFLRLIYSGNFMTKLCRPPLQLLLCEKFRKDL